MHPFAVFAKKDSVFYTSSCDTIKVNNEDMPTGKENAISLMDALDENVSNFLVQREQERDLCTLLFVRFGASFVSV